MNVSSGNITELKDNEIFVFGSNEGGKHGAGAAHIALKWGAKWGKAEGISGHTYAIPTKTADIRNTLSINRIGKYVKNFIKYASEHPELNFLITEIGCGLAGLTPEQVAPLFEPCINMINVYLPKRFVKILSDDKEEN